MVEVFGYHETCEIYEHNQMYSPSSLFKNCIIAVANLIHDWDVPASIFECLPDNCRNNLLAIITKRDEVKVNDLQCLLNGKTSELNLTNCDVSNEFLIQVQETCHRLNYLNLSACKCDRDNLNPSILHSIFTSSHHLNYISLKMCSFVSNASISELVLHCGKHLQEINLSECSNLDDKSMKYICSNCSHLKALNMSSTRITDQGVQHFNCAPCAKTILELDVSKCKKLSNLALEFIIGACENIKILLFHDCPLMTNENAHILTELHNRNRKLKQLSWTVI